VEPEPMPEPENIWDLPFGEPTEVPFKIELIRWVFKFFEVRFWWLLSVRSFFVLGIIMILDLISKGIIIGVGATLITLLSSVIGLFLSNHPWAQSAWEWFKATTAYSYLY
jgi:hypothetical protein